MNNDFKNFVQAYTESIYANYVKDGHRNKGKTESKRQNVRSSKRNLLIDNIRFCQTVPLSLHNIKLGCNDQTSICAG
jgi:hypothetical protein